MNTEEKQIKLVDEDDTNSKETWHIIKNVLVISVAFMMHFTAYGGAVCLQSSIHVEESLGTASLASVYAGLIFSTVFLPSLVIKWLGTKWAISISFLAYIPYIAAQLWPRFYTLIPAGIIVGFGGGPLWCAKNVYIYVVSQFYSQIKKIPAETALVQFVGLFFMIFQLCQIWGNLISSLVLSLGDNAAAVTSVNASTIPLVCGSNFLPSADATELLQPQPKEKIEMLFGIFLGCMAGAAAIVAVGVDCMEKYKTKNSSCNSELSGIALLAVTLKVMVQRNQMLLIIITLFLGYEQAFFGAEFTASFVSCAIGTGSVGFVMMSAGIANAIGCILTGYIGKMTGRIPLICFAFTVHLALFITMLIWSPEEHLYYVLYIIAVLWGFSESIWTVQLHAYYGIVFAGNEEGAYSNFGLWESCGFILCYITYPYLRTRAKIYFLLLMLTVGTTMYFIVEIKERSLTKKLAKAKNVVDSKGGDTKEAENVALLNNLRLDLVKT